MRSLLLCFDIPNSFLPTNQTKPTPPLLSFVYIISYPGSSPSRHSPTSFRVQLDAHIFPCLHLFFLIAVSLGLGWANLEFFGVWHNGVYPAFALSFSFLFSSTQYSTSLGVFWGGGL